MKCLYVSIKQQHKENIVACKHNGPIKANKWPPIKAVQKPIANRQMNQVQSCSAQGRLLAIYAQLLIKT